MMLLADAGDSAAASLALEYEGLLQLVYQVPVGIIQFDGAGRVGLVNPQVPRLLMPLMASCDDPDNIFAILRPCIPDLAFLLEASPTVVGLVLENRRIHVGSLAPGQPPIWASITVSRLGPGRFIATLSDISQLVGQEQRIRMTDSWFAAIMEGAEDYMYCTLDELGRVRDWNDTGEALTGWSREEILGMPVGLLFPPGPALAESIKERLRAAREQGWTLNTGRMLKRGGEAFSGDSLISMLDNQPGSTRFLLVTRRLAGGRVQAEELVRLATTDHLTGVLNRARLFELAEPLLARAAQRNEPLSILMLDADNFKAVNDSLGHAAGDAVLKALAGTCRESLRSIDLLGRIGGEEFVIVLPACELAVARVVAERLRRNVEAARLAAAMPAADQDQPEAITVTVSIGVAEARPGEPLEQLFHRADRLMYLAKKRGRNMVMAEEQCPAPAGNAAVA